MLTLKKQLARVAGLSAALVLASTPVVVSAATDSDTSTVTANVGSTITVSSAGTVTLNLSPAASAVLTSASDTVTVNTNNSAGYVLTLADSDAVRNLVSGGNTITPSAGTQASPTVLATGTWGYAVASVGGFGASYSVENNVVGSTTTWAGVPATGSPNTLKTTATTATNDVTTVWYAAEVDSSQPTGAYVDTVTYTATTN